MITAKQSNHLVVATKNVNNYRKRIIEKNQYQTVATIMTADLKRTHALGRVGGEYDGRGHSIN